MDYNLYYVTDQTLAPEFHIPCADIIYTHMQTDSSQHNLNSYAIFTIHRCYNQFQNYVSFKRKLGLQIWLSSCGQIHWQMDVSMQNKLLKWDFRFSWWCCWWYKSSGTWCCVTECAVTHMSKGRSDFIFMVTNSKTLMINYQPLKFFELNVQWHGIISQ